MQHGPWLKDFLVYLVAAGLIVPLFHRARIGAVLGFLLIGVVIGPYGLGRLADAYPWILYLTIEDRARVAPFAELGVMFLLFLVGLDLSMARLWMLRRFVLGVGGIQFAVSAFVIGTAASAVGIDNTAALVLGLCLAMSSTAVVMQLLEEQGRTGTPVGQLALAVLLFQDLMVAPVLFGTELLGRGGPIGLVGFAGALLPAVLAVVALAGAGYYLLRPLFRIAGHTGSRELIMAMALLIVVALAGVTERLGLSVALGAFLAGVLLSETEFRHQIEIDLAPVKGLLLGLFFITVGMTIDVRAAWNDIGLILVAVAVLVALKAIVAFGACAAWRIALPVGIEAALLLAQAGEFGFVVIALAGGRDLLPPYLAQFATVVIGISMVATPIGAVLARRIGQSMQSAADAAHVHAIDSCDLSDHIVIGGYGRVGQTVARLLEAENVPFVALDIDARLVAEERKRGRNVYYGDAGRSELLERVGARRARAFVVTVNAPHAAEFMVAAVRRQRPDALVIARAKDTDHAVRLLQLGAVGVIPETVEASLQLGGRVLEALGLPDEAVVQRLAAARAEALERLHKPAS
ncbi:MAG TPA: cation:proton antiporter [Alphaproteobacteria bacterium]